MQTKILAIGKNILAFDIGKPFIFVCKDKASPSGTSFLINHNGKGQKASHNQPHESLGS
jgi:hypothetical protein